MPTYVARAPSSALTVILHTKHAAPLPCYTAEDDLSGTIIAVTPVKVLKVSLRLCYRLVQPLFGRWDKHLAPDSDYLEQWSYKVASWRADDAGRSGEFDFGQFRLGSERMWLLAGRPERGRRFAAAILRASELPPSCDTKWPHLYWQVAIKVVDYQGRRSDIAIPILFFPSLSAPSMGTDEKALCSHSNSLRLSSLACLGSPGKLGVELSWPQVSTASKKDACVLIAGQSTPITLAVDLSRIPNGAIGLDDVTPTSVALRQTISGSTSHLDDVVGREKLHAQWQLIDTTDSKAIWQLDLFVPDSVTTSFTNRAFLLAVQHILTVTLRLPVAYGFSASFDVPVIITRSTSSPPLDEELTRLSAGFSVVGHRMSTRSCWPGSSRTIGKPPICISDDGKLLLSQDKTVSMTLNGDGFPRPGQDLAGEVADDAEVSCVPECSEEFQ